MPHRTRGQPKAASDQHFSRPTIPMSKAPISASARTRLSCGVTPLSKNALPKRLQPTTTLNLVSLMEPLNAITGIMAMSSETRKDGTLSVTNEGTTHNRTQPPRPKLSPTTRSGMHCEGLPVPWMPLIIKRAPMARSAQSLSIAVNIPRNRGEMTSCITTRRSGSEISATGLRLGA